MELENYIQSRHRSKSWVGPRKATISGDGDLPVPRPLPRVPIQYPLSKSLVEVSLPLPILRLAPENAERHNSPRPSLLEGGYTTKLQTHDVYKYGRERLGGTSEFSALEDEMSDLKTSMRRLELQSRALSEQSQPKFPSGDDSFRNSDANISSGKLEGHLNVTLARSFETNHIVSMDRQGVLQRQITQINTEVHKLERDQEEFGGRNLPAISGGLPPVTGQAPRLAIEGAIGADGGRETLAALRKGDVLAHAVHCKLKSMENERHAAVKRRTNRFLEKLDRVREDFSRGVMWRSDEDYLDFLARQDQEIKDAERAMKAADEDALQRLQAADRDDEVKHLDVATSTTAADDREDEVKHLHVATSTTSSLEQLNVNEGKEEDEPRLELMEDQAAFTVEESTRPAAEPCNYGIFQVQEIHNNHIYEEVSVDSLERMRSTSRKSRSRFSAFRRGVKRTLLCGCNSRR